MSTLDFQIERLILKSGNTLNNIRIEDLKNHNLTPAQSETILFYADNAGKSIKELSEHLKITHQAAKKLIDKLKEKNILKSITSKDDKRYVSIYLTDLGHEVYNELKKKGTTTGEILLKNFSIDEKKILFEFFQRIEKNLLER